MLKTHTTIEEEIFYPAARKARIEAALLDEADIEHASAKDLIAQIESGNPADDHYDAKVKVLGEYITHHVVEEHTEMFPKCRRAGMDLVALRGRMQARQAELGPDAAAESVDNPPDGRLGRDPRHTFAYQRLLALGEKSMKTHAISAEEWRERCARRVRELDREMSESEAQTVAQDVYDFERTRAMQPEEAADFLAAQMSQAEPPRFERRSKKRAENAPLMRSILRYLTEPKGAS